MARKTTQVPQDPAKPSVSKEQAMIREPLTPKFETTAEWFAELHRLAKLADEPFMAGGREQSRMPFDKKIFD